MKVQSFRGAKGSHVFMGVSHRSWVLPFPTTHTHAEADLRSRFGTLFYLPYYEEGTWKGVKQNNLYVKLLQFFPADLHHVGRRVEEHQTSSLLSSGELSAKIGFLLLRKHWVHRKATEWLPLA